MNKSLNRTLYSVLIIALAACAPVKKHILPQVSNTIEILPADSKEEIIAKAVRVVPTASQYEALQNEFIAFIHFGPNTFTRMEWGSGMEDPKIFDLKELHTDQWCEAMKDAGMKMVIITVKHHDGFVLWQSRYTNHGIMSTNFQNGNGDILKDLAASCKKFGLKLGIYLSPADLFQIESPTGLYGNLSKYTMRSIPRDVPGRPFANKTKFEFEVDDYNEYFLNQLFELLTEYGEVHELWFDGAHPKTKGGQQYNYAAWKSLIRALAPNAVIFGKEDVRWCGNESGGTRNTEWNVIGYPENPNTANNFPDLTEEDLGSREKLYKAKFLHYQQAETNTSIREGWFYRDDTHQKVRNADDVFDIYERSVGGNSTFLLNIPPNREGKFSAEDVAVLKETGKRIRETYSDNLFKGAIVGSPLILDNNGATYVTLSEFNKDFTIKTAQPVTVNRVILQESIATHSERIEKHALDAFINGEWKEIATATNVGYKRILRFPEITASEFRIRILESRAEPAIATISAHYYKTKPPRLQITRDKNGFVRIATLQHEFAWKPHGEDAGKNLNTGMEIFYTTDGSQPNAGSKKYTEPFAFGNGVINSVAILKSEKGSIASRRLGMIAKDWKLVEVSSQAERGTAALAFDANNKTWWESQPGNGPHYISLDLGKPANLEAFAYTPQNINRNGMLEKGVLKISDNGQNWRIAEEFEFGNLINDPSTRFHHLKSPVQTRFVRLEAIRIAGGDNRLSVAELEFFE